MNGTVSSVLQKDQQPINSNHVRFPTWGLIAILIVAFFVLKTFIYVKDKKRHGK